MPSTACVRRLQALGWALTRLRGACREGAQGLEDGGLGTLSSVHAGCAGGLVSCAGAHCMLWQGA